MKLKLNWELSSEEDRLLFIQSYIPQALKAGEHLTDANLEMCANYVLWGRDENGKNANERGEIQLEGRFKRSSGPSIQSLDAMAENLDSDTPILETITPYDVPLKRAKTPTFNRDEARQEAPAALLPTFESLWHSIDELELLTTFYQQKIGRRQTDPRKELLDRFTLHEIEAVWEHAQALTAREAQLAAQHLIENRQAQFEVRDSYRLPLPRAQYAPIIHATTTPLIEGGLFPLYEAKAALFYRPLRELAPQTFTKTELQTLSYLLWLEPSPDAIQFDFSSQRDLSFLIDAAPHIFNEDDPFLKTLRFHSSELEPRLRDLLEMRLKAFTNQEIADTLNQKYGFSYSPHYISTLFNNTVLPRIADHARLHRQILENLFFPENFKRCVRCGTTLLRSPVFFTRKNKSADGYVGFCKACDKRLRQQK